MAISHSLHGSARDYDQEADLAKATSHPVRLHILDLLGRGEMRVTRIAQRVNQPMSTVSKHLNFMKARGVVASRRSGHEIYYRVADPRLLRVMSLMSHVLEDRSLSPPRRLPPMSRAG